VTGFRLAAKRNRIEAVHTQAQQDIEGDFFILSAGAWSGTLVDMYNSTLATAQVLGFVRLTDDEMERYRNLPTYIDFTTGVFCFPPHPREKFLKVAVHGWGYTRASRAQHKQGLISSPPTEHHASRTNFAPADGIRRLKQGLVDILPEFASREFERVNVCWYTDTPTGDFIIDKHPAYANLHLATGGSGQ
jgi:sarcosine oxidase/L-pipecolate oxidase